MTAKLTDINSIEDVLSEMTLEEKAQFVIGGSPMSSCPMEKYGIPAMQTNDCCNGLNTFQYAVEQQYQEIVKQMKDSGKSIDRESMGMMGGLFLAVGALQKKAAAAKKAGVKIPESYPIISYPTGISIASTWNPDVAEKCAREVAREFISKGIDVILSPNVNIHRNPLCGRLTESYSEDPYLTSRMAERVVTGLQDEGVIANPKHFAANSQETDRLEINEKIPERALREIYFPAFRACVRAGALTIMSAYNHINDVPCAQNKWLLKDVLRDEWGFDGCVISDWGASYDLVAAIDAGTDLTMPGPRGIKSIIDAVNSGKFPEESLNDACRNIMKVIVKSKRLENRPVTFNLDQAKEVVKQAAREALILLKNDGTLPLNPREENLKVAFYGRRAKNFVANSEGSGKVPSMFVTNPYDRTAEIIGKDNVTFVDESGYPLPGTKNFIVVVGAEGQEGADRTTMDMDRDDQTALEKAIADAEKVDGKVILVSNSSGPVTLTPYMDSINAILCPFFAGQAGGEAAADAIFGEYNPSGKLPDTWPAHYHDVPSYKNYGGENKEVWYGEGIYVGYRWYDARKIRPLFPFGYGLSYTTFELTNLKVADTNIDQNDLHVSVDVKNTGDRYGAEVVQLYISAPVTEYLDKPEKELKGFKKIFLEPGEEQTVEFVLHPEDIAHFSTALEEWVTEPGKYSILVGTSAVDISQKKEIQISCRDPFGWSVITGIGKLVTNPNAVKIINDAIGEDINLVAAIAIQYAPDRTLKELWEGNMIRDVFKKHGRSMEDMKAAWKYIVGELKKL